MIELPLIYAWEIPIYLLVYSECLPDFLFPKADNDCYEPLDHATYLVREMDRPIN